MDTRTQLNSKQMVTHADVTPFRVLSGAVVFLQAQTMTPM